ncbi:glycosyl hydrolase family 79 C-terminal domain-containing protein [uncultured Mucilaginibacter sp.]|uniref:glycosyl hydrolase family 79 C-terminal domain-containing protein n=1 Tax=uncultured Mucilaginibacter sp. TaxID=797541 RepID=UPI0025F80387|nr:glycosyl hydrolase family 79 C-terminal domain-containing protein [uncultured Mucilaginibacter sp.]
MRKIPIIILVVALIFSCRKNQLQLPPAPGELPVTITLNQSQAGYSIPPTFEGLSFETKILTNNPGFLNVNNPVLIQMIRNLGPGVLRIGGETCDEVFWSDNPRNPSSGRDTLTISDIDRLAAFSMAIGWQVLFGLNLGSNDLVKSSNEAAYAGNRLAGNLLAFQSGNEPDVFHNGIRPRTYNFSNFQDEWEAYLTAIKTKVPNASFAGPDVAYNTDWITAFAVEEHYNIKLLDCHYYMAGPATSPNINYQTILADDGNLPGYLAIIKSQAKKYNLPYRISESNNVYGGGKAGVSDVFASALWALDFMWIIAENNGSGINFHTGDGLFYSPISTQNGVLQANPEYYAMLAFNYASTGGKIIPASISNSELCSAYACVKPDNSYVLTLINKDEKNNASVTILLNKTASGIQIQRLTAPSLNVATGITFAGSTVNADGTFEAKTTEQYAVAGNSVVVKVPAGSAAIVTVR